MRPNQMLFVIGLICLCAALLSSQTIEPGNQINASVKAAVDYKGNSSFDYAYSVSSSRKSKQKIWQFYIFSGIQGHNVTSNHSPAQWKLAMPEGKHGVDIRWGTPGGNEIGPGHSLSGFRMQAVGVPGIVDYYAEGYAPAPAWEESVEEDSIPGYDDVTPYGPGIVGKTIGPVQPPDASDYIDFVDTLISYKHRSISLGWLGNDKYREQECERTIRGRGWYRKHEVRGMRNWKVDDSWNFDRDWNNGIVGVLDRRLEKAKQALTRGDSVKSRRELQIFVMEVDLVYRLGEKSRPNYLYDGMPPKAAQDARGKKQDVRNKKSEVRGQKAVMTSEAYALLKFNAEYLIDRLPAERRRGRK